MATIKLRRDTATNWTNVNPVLALGEPGVEIDTNKLKIGDGSTDWNTLSYVAGSGGGGDSILTQNGAYIRQQNEEGLVIWQPAGTDEDDAEYVAVWYGGQGDEDDPDISITAGTYNWAVDDGNLEFLNYENTHANQGPRQINLDIKHPVSGNILNWHFDESGNVYLPAEPTVSTTSGIVFGDGSIQTSGLSPELKKVEGNLVSTTNLNFAGEAKGLILEIDSGGNFDVWFNSTTGDADGNTYAVGSNDDGYDFAYAVDNAGTIKWKVGFDQINGNNFTPYVVKCNNDGVPYVAGNYYDGNSNQLVFARLSATDGSVESSWVMTNNNIGGNGSYQPYDIAFDNSNNPIVVGETNGESAQYSNVTAQSGSKLNTFVFNNSDLNGANPSQGGSWYVQTIPGDNNSWYSVNDTNYIHGLPVTAVTGNGADMTVSFQYTYNGSAWIWSYGYIDTPGSGYNHNDQLKVLGSAIGGTDGYQFNDVSAVSFSTVDSTTVVLFDKTTYPNLIQVSATANDSDSIVYGGNLPSSKAILSVSDAGSNWQVVIDGADLDISAPVSFTNNGGDDIYFSYYYYYSYWQGVNTAYTSVPTFISDTTRFGINQGVDFRGPENTTTFTAGSDYTAGDFSVVYDIDIDTYYLKVTGAHSNITSLIAYGDVITVGYNTGSTTTLTINGPLTTIPTLGGTGYVLSGNPGTGEVAIDSMVVPNGTYNTATWNIRGSLDTQAFIWTLSNDWQHTYGATNSQSFRSVSYDLYDNSVYATGDFYYYDGSRNHRAMIMKIDNSTGETLWAKYVDDADVGGDNTGTVLPDGLGNVFLVSENDNGYTMVTKLNGSGVIQWQSTQNNNSNWNNYPIGGLDADGNVIVMGSWYDDNDGYYKISFQKIHKDDGSLIWARLLGDTQDYDIYDYYDEYSQGGSVVGTSMYYAGYVYDRNDDQYVGVAIRLPTDGSGIGTLDRWTYTEDTDASWYLSNNGSTSDGSFGSVDSQTLSINELSVSVTADNVGNTTPNANAVGGGAGIGGVNQIEFSDGTVLDTAFPGIKRYSTTYGDNNITLSLEQNGKFLHYNGYDGNSWIYVPSDEDVLLPIGFTVTIVMDNFGSNRIYVNNDVGPANANINAVGYSPGTTNYWQIGSNGNTGIYTIMKVDSNRWILSGPDVQVD